MKKLLLALAMTATMAVSSVCAAAGDGTVLNKEQKAAEAMTAALTSDTATYEAAATGFNADLKGKLTAQNFTALKTQIKSKLGNMKDARFVNFTRFKDGDKVDYVGSFSKEAQVHVMYIFDSTGKIMNFAFTPIKPQAQQQAAAPAKAAE